MLITAGTSGLKRAKWYEYVLRFVLGGLVTAGAGELAKVAGPSFAGLFLAFPAILVASATLVAKHEREEKEEKGQPGKTRGRQAAGVDVAGAAMGSLGLIIFAVLAWQLLPGHNTWLVLGGATLAWCAVSVGVWWIRKMHLRRRLKKVFRHRLAKA
jgi:hypothetical protein